MRDTQIVHKTQVSPE